MGLDNFRARIRQIEKIKENGKTVYKIVKLEKPEDFEYKAGQYVMLAHPELRDRETEEPLWRPFSIASSPLQEHLEFAMLVRYTGGFTEFLEKNAKPGHELLVSEPMGNGHFEHSQEKVIFVATGCGIAPFMSIIRTLLAQGSEMQIQLFYGFRTAKQFLYRNELENYAKKFDNFELYAAASEDNNFNGFKGFLMPLLNKYAFKDRNVPIYMCGSNTAMNVLESHLRKLRYRNIIREDW